jgi:hypothetical protein
MVNDGLGLLGNFHKIPVNNPYNSVEFLGLRAKLIYYGDQGRRNSHKIPGNSPYNSIEFRGG